MTLSVGPVDYLKTFRKFKNYSWMNNRSDLVRFSNLLTGFRWTIPMENNGSFAAKSSR